MNTKYIIKYVWGNQEDMIKYVWEAHNFEIKNLWQRSILLVPLIVMAFTAMGILQLKIIDDITKCKDECMPLLCAEVFVCGAGVILSLFWVALAKASKFIQEAHEEHLKGYLKKCSVSLKTNYALKYFNAIIAYCNLDDHNKDSCFFSLKPSRYSPSKINILLGWFSASIFAFVGIINFLYILCNKCLFVCNPYCLLLIVMILLFVVFGIYLIESCKGGNNAYNQRRNKQKSQNETEESK